MFTEKFCIVPLAKCLYVNALKLRYPMCFQALKSVSFAFGVFDCKRIDLSETEKTARAVSILVQHSVTDQQQFMVVNWWVRN